MLAGSHKGGWPGPLRDRSPPPTREDLATLKELMDKLEAA